LVATIEQDLLDGGLIIGVSTFSTLKYAERISCFFAFLVALHLSSLIPAEEYHISFT